MFFQFDCTKLVCRCQIWNGLYITFFLSLLLSKFSGYEGRSDLIVFFVIEGESYGAAIWKIPELYGQLNSPQLERMRCCTSQSRGSGGECNRDGGGGYGCGGGGYGGSGYGGYGGGPRYSRGGVTSDENWRN